MRTPTPLKLAIAASGLRQREIAATVGCDDSQLSRWVNGLHCQDPATRAAIAAAVGRQVGELWPDLHDAQPDAVAAGSDAAGRKAA